MSLCPALAATPDVAGSMSVAPECQKVRRPWLATRGLDWAERVLVVGLYGWLVARILAHYWAEGNPANLLLLPSEGLVLVFMLIRRPATEVSRSPGEWLLAFAVSCSVMLASPGNGLRLVSPAVGACVLLMGIIVQVHAKLVLGRSFGCVPAHRGLKVGGPYRLVRHPMYLGYLISHTAFLAMNLTVWNVVVYGLCYSLQIPRLLAEERLLARDPDYQTYQQAVPYHLVPGVF